MVEREFSDRLIHLNPWITLGGTVWEGLGGMAELRKFVNGSKLWDIKSPGQPHELSLSVSLFSVSDSVSVSLPLFLSVCLPNLGLSIWSQLPHQHHAFCYDPWHDSHELTLWNCKKPPIKWFLLKLSRSCCLLTAKEQQSRHPLDLKNKPEGMQTPRRQVCFLNANLPIIQMQIIMEGIFFYQPCSLLFATGMWTQRNPLFLVKRYFWLTCFEQIAFLLHS